MIRVGPVDISASSERNVNWPYLAAYQNQGEPAMHYGPWMIDLEGQELTPKEGALLKHPGVGGIILYARNYSTYSTLKSLITQIRSEAKRPLLIAVDHEGGKVWQFFEGFNPTQTAAHFGQLYAMDSSYAVMEAEKAGFLMASELIAVGIDISFAPVLDLNKGISALIGERSFHQDPNIVVELAGAFIKGMNAAGMKATGKHFPGHGNVTSDTHLESAIDARKYELFFVEDMIPFIKLSQKLGAVMPAHIVFPEVDTVPVGYSKRWLQNILRRDLKFTGAIISDCLSMKGAAIEGNFVLRARLALEAGCDMVMLCNQDRDLIQWVLDKLDRLPSKESQARLQAMAGNRKIDMPEMIL